MPYMAYLKQYHYTLRRSAILAFSVIQHELQKLLEDRLDFYVGKINFLSPML